MSEIKEQVNAPEKIEENEEVNNSVVEESVEANVEETEVIDSDNESFSSGISFEADRGRTKIRGTYRDSDSDSDDSNFSDISDMEVKEVIEIHSSLLQEINEIASICGLTELPAETIDNLMKYLVEFVDHLNDPEFVDEVVNTNPFYEHIQEVELVSESEDDDDSLKHALSVYDKVGSELESDNEEDPRPYIDVWVDFTPKVVEKRNHKKHERRMTPEEFDVIDFDLDDFKDTDNYEKIFKIWDFEHSEYKLVNVKENGNIVTQLQVCVTFWNDSYKGEREDFQLPNGLTEAYYREIANFLKTRPYEFTNSRGNKAYLRLILSSPT